METIAPSEMMACPQPRPADLECARQRVRALQLLVGHETGGHQADDHVDERADEQRAQDAARHVALRIARLLGGGRDGVEADVGEEDDARRPRWIPRQPFGANGVQFRGST